MKNLYIIAYDISKNKIRKKTADILLSYGGRINLSVFECMLSKTQLNEIIEQFKTLINKKTDSIKIYHICSTCFSKSIIIGKPEIQKTISNFV